MFCFSKRLHFDLYKTHYNKQTGGISIVRSFSVLSKAHFVLELCVHARVLIRTNHSIPLSVLVKSKTKHLTS